MICFTFALTSTVWRPTVWVYAHVYVYVYVLRLLKFASRGTFFGIFRKERVRLGFASMGTLGIRSFRFLGFASNNTNNTSNNDFFSKKFRAISARAKWAVSGLDPRICLVSFSFLKSFFYICLSPKKKILGPTKKLKWKNKNFHLFLSPGGERIWWYRAKGWWWGCRGDSGWVRGGGLNLQPGGTQKFKISTFSILGL